MRCLVEKFLCALVLWTLASGAWAQASSKPQGTWVIDPTGTAEVMKRTAPPREPGIVGGIVAYWFQTTLEFDDEGVTMGVYTSATTLRYRLVPSRDGTIAYVLDRAQDGVSETLSISMLGDQTLHVKSSRPTFIELCAWRRGSRMDSKGRIEASKEALETWQSAMRSVAAAWDSK